MNIIPLTFNEHQVARTVLGGKLENPYKMNCSVILLNENGSHLNSQSLENLSSCGFKSIVSVEPTPESYNLEDISRRYPNVKFIIPLEECTQGEIINMCMEEVSSSYVLVLRDSLHVPQNILNANLFENLTSEKTYCIVPRLFDSSNQPVFVNIMPESQKGYFQVTPANFVSEGLPTMCPFDFIGLYNREKFILLGGYDYTIKSSYWQNLDLSMRAWLWGERITISPSFKISFTSEVPVLDSTRNLSYIKFYIKNILPKFKDDHGIIPFSSFFGYLFHSSSGFLETCSQFKSARNWVRLNKYRFKKDAKYLVENWVGEK